jgi:hypothetical protein
VQKIVFDLNETRLTNQNVWKYIQLIIVAVSGIDITGEFAKIRKK